MTPMHNEAERLRVLAEKLDPRPGPNHADYLPGYEWAGRQHARERLFYIATPGALLGAAVHLLVFKYSTAKMLVMLHEATAEAMLGDGDVLAALIAAMEEVEI